MEAITSPTKVPPTVDSWDQLPSALNFLIGEVVYLRTALAERTNNQQQPDQWFNLEEFCQYHPAKPAPTTVYGWVSRRVVPHKRDGKHLYFLKSEIDLWLKGKNRKTTADLMAEADQHPTRQRRGGRKAL